MSAWRLRGFVQDSDEEEDDIETLPVESTGTDQRVSEERVANLETSDGILGEVTRSRTTTNGDRNDAENASKTLLSESRESGVTTTPVTYDTPRHLGTDLRAEPASHNARISTESPDPLQDSSTPATSRIKKLPSSQGPAPPTAPTSRTDGKVQTQDDSRKKLQFDLSLLSDSDDDLSDPPSDLEQYTVFASPKRRTEVRVVIPPRRFEAQATVPLSSTTEQDLITETINRSLRARQPIQLHPYLLEAEKYKRDFQSRGIKPIVRVVSPTRKPAHPDDESQEQEFNPDDESPVNSQQGTEQSTPTDHQVKERVLHQRSIHRRRSISATDKISSPGASSTKRRKLNRPSTQVASTSRGSSTLARNPHHNIWSVPDSPPQSSSPPRLGDGPPPRRLARPFVDTPIANLPTPSNSSIMDAFPPMVETDSDSDDSVTPRVQQPGVTPRRPLEVPSDSPSADSPEEDPGLVRVRKRIKGVLPASYVTFDKLVQQQRRLEASRRANAISPPDKAEPQRGVAQKITRRIDSTRNSESDTRHNDIVEISDESDTEPALPPRSLEDTETVAHNASEMAADLDRRYADDDSDDMVHDRLDLFTLGGVTRKRQRQTKLSESFANTKKSTPFSMDKLNARSAPSHSHAKKRQTGPRRTRHISPPALSILDLDQSPSRSDRPLPQFLRVAMRQARKRPDGGRQSARGKAIRLHTVRDTEDANATLKLWNSGAIRPKPNIKNSRQSHKERQPLTARSDNQQQLLASPIDKPQPEGIGPAFSPEAIPNRPTANASGVRKFRKAPAASKPSQTVVKSSRTTQRFQQPTGHNPLPFRTAQLEGLETEFGNKHREIAFARGLQRVEQQFNFQLPFAQSFRNPQLARFLADDSELPPLPTAEDIEEAQEAQNPEETAAQTPAKRPLRRKPAARRIDVDTREYRQPSEPAVQEVLHDLDVQEVQTFGGENDVLNGLGPFGTRYPLNFDVTPLKVGTFFQSTTFIGSEEFRLALKIGKPDARDLDETTGIFIIQHGNDVLKCGSWNDETYSCISDVVTRLFLPLSETEAGHLQQEPDTRISDVSSFLRSMISYISLKLGFFDSVDRHDFAMRMEQLIESLFKKTLEAYVRDLNQGETRTGRAFIRPMAYLLVLALQCRQISKHTVVDTSTQMRLDNLVKKIARAVITHVVDKAIPELGNFLDKNKMYKERENGIQEDEVLVEGLVICTHVLDSANITGTSFWGMVNHELSTRIMNANHLRVFESSWASVFTLLPFGEIDSSGILVANQRSSLDNDDWTFVRDALKRLFELYPSTFKKHGFSLNDYVRASLMRCHVLMDKWKWRRCDPMLNTVFDFFGKNGLKLLRREYSKGSAQFLESIVDRPSLDVQQDDSSFHIFLKCLALGLCVMQQVYPEKKIRSIVFRLTPNHGRSYPKEQSLDQESLDALHNHHDLLCTLYWASPSSCRPKVDLLRGLVQHENSHREACRTNVRAWTNLATFQLAAKEPDKSMEPFASWGRDIIQQTLKQYRLAKTEAEDYMVSAQGVDSNDITRVMVQQTMEKNQEQVIATLRDCIAGMDRALECSSDQILSREFLVSSSIVQLLELPHVEDARLIAVIRDTLGILRRHITLRKESPRQHESQDGSEGSQDYGDFPDLDEFMDVDEPNAVQAPKQPTFGFIETPLWHLLSNAFGADRTPNENLLMDCIDTWVLVAGCHVSLGDRSWSYYVDSFSKVSWKQLRHTEQTRKFTPYYLSALIAGDSTVYEEHQQDFLSLLMVSLAERESQLRFQYRLLQSIIKADPTQPLFQNLPFVRIGPVESAGFDITADTLRTRRLPLISSILANMRDNFHYAVQNHLQPAEVRRQYTSILQGFMNAMRNNYQQLRQGSTVAGAYVEFVQRVVQFLTQYTSDICAVLPFFTEAVHFPLPATDPKYVVGRLYGYAPKLSAVGAAKQLSVFIKTIVQQATADNHHPYLLGQLNTALCGNVAPVADRTSLRNVLLQGIVPVYIESALSSVVTLIVTKPLLQMMTYVAEPLVFDLNFDDESSLRSVCNIILSTLHAIIRGTEGLKDDPTLLTKSYVLQGTSLMFDAAGFFMPLLEYICGRVANMSTKSEIAMYLERLGVFILERVNGMNPTDIPSYRGDAHASPPEYSDLLSFSKKDLEASMQTNWTESQGCVFLGHGHARKEVIVDIGSMEEERAGLEGAIKRFHGTLARLYGSAYGIGDGHEHERSLLADLDV
ncbi:hypothetical protein BS50DRAFT_557766 [Corynespora cassiicola Philippines]|uniref:Mus7/MMS22 family-domain-containing protein n=1 Tax=Corynespora cassiicola Philippines TaxID=1448308 RepID=A0A2T2NE01_CORCC|nr:hypothetical protein BS50DRAFT_557766 [Corynespora cassiicola Philippines]